MTTSGDVGDRRAEVAQYTTELSDVGNGTSCAELELDPLRHAEPMKFVVQNV